MSLPDYRAAFLRWRDRIGGWPDRALRAHPWLGNVPWSIIFATTIVGGGSLLRGEENWLTWASVACLHVAFFSAGRLWEMRKAGEWMRRSMEMDAKIVLEQAKLSFAYQRLHMRHFKMTGENYSDNADSIDMPNRDRAHDA